MDNVAPTEATHRPSRLQLAVALTLVRSKPADLSISGMSEYYIDSLRRNIASATRPQFSQTYEESQQKYLNAALHFKGMLEESIKKEEELRNRLAAAEMEMERLRGQIIADAHADGGARKKRKSIPYMDDEQACSGAEEGIVLDERHFQKLAQVRGQVGDGWPEARSLMRSVFYLRKALNAKHPNDIMPTLVNCCITSTKLIDQLSQTTYQLPSPIIFRALQNGIMPLILSAFQKLDVRGPSTTDARNGAAMHEMLRLVRALMSYITKRSTQIAADWRTANPGTAESSPYDEHDRTCINILRAFIYHFRESEDSEYASDSLPGFKTKVKHSEVLEGVLFLLLDRAGMLLYELLFAEDGSSESVAAARREANLLMPLYRILLPEQVHSEFDLPEEANNRPPGEPVTKKLKKLNPSDEYAQVMKGAKQMNNRRTLTAKLKGTPASRSLLGQKHSLSRVPLNKIQNTLLRGMFGRDQGTNGGLSGMCLRDPLELGTNSISGADGETEDEMDLDRGMPARETSTDGNAGAGKVGEAFVMEMWYRVGWDVLANGFSAGLSA